MNKLLSVCFVVLFAFIVNAQQRSVSARETLTSPLFNSQQPVGVLNVTPNDTLNYISASGSIYSVTGGGMVVGPNKYGDLGKYQRFDLAQGYLLKGFGFYTYVKSIVGTPDTMSFVVKSVNGDGSPGTTLATIKQTTNLLNASGFTYFTLPTALPVSKSIFIGYEWSATGIDDTLGLACDKAGLGYGNGAMRAWEKSSTGAYIAMQTNWGASFDVDLWILAIGEKVLPISAARIDANADLIPDRLNDTLTIAGVVFTPNYQTSNRSYFIWDGTGGICTFRTGMTSPALNLGDSVVIRGYMAQYKGLDEFTPLTDASVWVVGTGTVQSPTILAPGQFKLNPEQYEANLVRFSNLSKISGAWPGTLTMSNGNDTVTVYLDSDTDVPGSPEPVWPRDLIGVVSQYAASGVSTGYQIEPRYYATDFPIVTPVELSSLSANLNGKSVIINWSTATEKNNMGFEIQKSTDNSSFVKIGFVNGNGTTTESKKYSYADNNVSSTKNYYRLKQMDYDGSYKISPVVEAGTSAVTSFALDQNFPNPFNPTTQIKYALLANSNVKVTIYNALGEKMRELTNEIQQSGVHVVNFNAAGLSSGVYFYSIQANAVDGSKNFTATKKMILMK